MKKLTFSMILFCIIVAAYILCTIFITNLDTLKLFNMCALVLTIFDVAWIIYCVLEEMRG